MINFNIQYDDLKYIFAALKNAIGKTWTRSVCQYIKFQCADGVLTAQALDGYRAHSVSVPVDVHEGSSIFSFLLKPFSLPKTDSSFIPCKLTSSEIEFDFGERKFIEKLGKGIEDFVNLNNVIPTSPVVFKIGFNPQYLADAAKSLTTKNSIRDPLVMEFYGDLLPAKLYSMRNKENYRIVLPVRVKEENNA